jgi:hypothetical protein
MEAKADGNLVSRSYLPEAMNAPDRPAVVDFAAPANEKSDLDLLLDYMGGAYGRRIGELAKAHAVPIIYKFDCAELMRKANFFQLELIGWLGLSSRIRAEEYARALDVTKRVEGSRLADRGPKVRSTAAMIEADALENVAPLDDAITRIEQTIRFCEKLTSSAQTQLRAMSEDEFAGRAEQNAGGWDDFVQAPIENALERLGRR